MIYLTFFRHRTNGEHQTRRSIPTPPLAKPSPPGHNVGPKLPENPPEWMLNMPKLSNESVVWKDFPQDSSFGDDDIDYNEG